MDEPTKAEAVSLIQANRLDIWEGYIIRCGCEKNADRRITHGVDEKGNLLPCPTPRMISPRGMMSYHHEGHPYETAYMNFRIWINWLINTFKDDNHPFKTIMLAGWIRIKKILHINHQ